MQIVSLLVFESGPHVWVSSWISMTTQTRMNRKRYCWLNPPSGLKLLQCHHCAHWFFFFFFLVPSNLPKVRVLILWINLGLFFFFIRAVPRPHKEETLGTETWTWWTFNCTLMCDRAGRIVFQEPHKQRMLEASCLLLLFQLCTFILIFFFSPASDVKGFGTKMHARGGGKKKKSWKVDQKSKWKIMSYYWKYERLICADFLLILFSPQKEEPSPARRHSADSASDPWNKLPLALFR